MRLFVLLMWLVSVQAVAQGVTPPAKYGLLPENVAVVINDDDADSVSIGAYYREARNIPAKNMVHVSLPDSPRKLGAAAFQHLREKIEARLGPEIQVIVLAWTTPYAVECNSITAAMTLGYDAGQCEKTCARGKPSPYFSSTSVRPYTDFGMRLTMLLPATPVARARALIDRGVVSGFTVYPATAYYLSTSDAPRNIRSRFFPPSGAVPARKLRIVTKKADVLEDAQDVMIYQTGLASVGKLESLRFMPGALADHFTSTGGDLLGTSQMSILRWLDAGATASYGTVSEPCNHWQKFPHPGVLLKNYLAGATAVEAYWKSVAWPAQGLVIGEPLAAPYRR